MFIVIKNYVTSKLKLQMIQFTLILKIVLRRAFACHDVPELKHI